MDKEKIFRDLEKQRKDRGLTLADAEYIFQQNNFDFKSELVLCGGFNGNVVYWKGWNEKAIKLLNEYLVKFNLYKCPTSVIMYMSSGVVLMCLLLNHCTTKQSTGFLLKLLLKKN